MFSLDLVTKFDGWYFTSFVKSIAIRILLAHIFDRGITRKKNYEAPRSTQKALLRVGNAGGK